MDTRINSYSGVNRNLTFGMIKGLDTEELIMQAIREIPGAQEVVGKIRSNPSTTLCINDSFQGPSLCLVVENKLIKS